MSMGAGLPSPARLLLNRPIRDISPGRNMEQKTLITMMFNMKPSVHVKINK